MRPTSRIAVLLVFLAILLAPPCASATWSIVAVDPATRQVGSAGASCTDFVAGILDLAPGHGVIVAQAQSNMQAKRRGKQLLADGMAPADVLSTIANPEFDPTWQQQQYGIAAFTGSPTAVGFTGAETAESHGDRQGTGFSVQGNILTSPNVLASVFAAFTAPDRLHETLAERLLAALEAGAAAGGDRRCGDQKARSAFLVVASATDTPEKPSVDLVVPAQVAGGANPLPLLRTMFEAWKNGVSGR